MIAQDKNKLKNKNEIKEIIKEGGRLERICKGGANHWRISIILLVGKRSGLSVEDISELLGGNFKNISMHTNKLVSAGLLNKYPFGSKVLHELSPYGRMFKKLFESL